MARGPLTFRQNNVTRMVKAVVAAGVEVLRVEVDKDGKIIVVTSETGKTAPAIGVNEWDEA